MSVPPALLFTNRKYLILHDTWFFFNYFHTCFWFECSIRCGKNLRKQFPTQEIGTKFLPQQKPPDENPLRCRGSGTSTARNAAPCQARQISEKWFHFEVAGVDDEKSWIHDEIAWHSFSQVVKFYGNAFFAIYIYISTCETNLIVSLWKLCHTCSFWGTISESPNDPLDSLVALPSETNS